MSDNKDHFKFIDSNPDSSNKFKILDLYSEFNKYMKHKLYTIKQCNGFSISRKKNSIVFNLTISYHQNNEKKELYPLDLTGTNLRKICEIDQNFIPFF